MFAISLCAEVFDPDGDILLRPESGSELSAIGRRVSRTATLDGNAVIEDNGYTSADSTLRIVIKPRSVTEEDRLIRLVQIYPLLILTTRYGAYIGAIDDYRPDGAGKIVLRYLVKQRISA